MLEADYKKLQEQGIKFVRAKPLYALYGLKRKIHGKLLTEVSLNFRMTLWRMEEINQKCKFGWDSNVFATF